MEYFNLAAYSQTPVSDTSLYESASASSEETLFEFYDPTPVITPLDHPDTTISISTVFRPSAGFDYATLPDLVLVSYDRVHFHVHSHRILGASFNQFNLLLTVPMKDNTLYLPETAPVLNVILHTLYSLSCATFKPPFETLSEAVGALEIYGLPVKQYVAPYTPLYTLLLAQAPLRPIDYYALAAEHDLYTLAAAISPHLLSYNLPSLTDELVTRMGPVYLKRLFFLHNGRIYALKAILLRPPHPHPQTPDCTFETQRKLTRAWALVTAHLAWDARPDMSVSSIEAVLDPLQDEISCNLCKETFQGRKKEIIVRWTAVKRTI